MQYTEVSLPSTSLPSNFATVEKILGLFWPKMRFYGCDFLESYKNFDLSVWFWCLQSQNHLENELRLILPLIIQTNFALKFLVVVKIHYRRIRYRRRSDRPFFDGSETLVYKVAENIRRTSYLVVIKNSKSKTKCWKYQHTEMIKNNKKI